MPHLTPPPPRLPSSADEFCSGYPHSLLPTPGYWIECAGQTVPDDTIWDESEPELDDASPQSDHPDKADQNIQVKQHLEISSRHLLFMSLIAWVPLVCFCQYSDYFFSNLIIQVKQ